MTRQHNPGWIYPDWTPLPSLGSAHNVSNLQPLHRPKIKEFAVIVNYFPTHCDPGNVPFSFKLINRLLESNDIVYFYIHVIQLVQFLNTVKQFSNSHKLRYLGTSSLHSILKGLVTGLNNFSGY